MSTIKNTAILFVCKGNICRSPTAEGVFRRKVEVAGLVDEFIIDSADTHTYHVGEPPDLRSQECAAKRGIDLSRQRARKVAPDYLSRFDLILAMDKANLALLEAACPTAYRHKLGLLMEYATQTKAVEVPNPYWGGARGFDVVLDYIEDASEGLLQAPQQK